MTFSYTRGNAGPQNLDVYYGNSATISATAPINPVLLSGAQYVPSTSTQTASNIDFTGKTNTSGSTFFFLYAYNSSNQGTNGWVGINNITFTGCRPAQTIEKTFSSETTSTNESSTLTFTLKNYDTVSSSLMAFSDTLPAGLLISSTSPTSTCGTVTAVKDTSLISLTNGTIPAKQSGESYGSCTISISVTGSASGIYDNISSYLSKNGTPLNSKATDTLTVLDPPVIAKAFSPNPIYAGQTSQLVFTISNPNQATSLTGVNFTDSFSSANLTVNSTPTTTCTDGVVNSTSGSVSLSGATVPAGETCTVTVGVSSSVVNTDPGYANSVTVHSTNGGTGNTAEDTLIVQSVHPSISILKEAATSSSGPWAAQVNVAPAPSGEVYYHLTVENTGDVPLSPVSVTDVTSPVNALVDTDVSSCTWPSVLPVASATQDPTATCIIGPFDPVTGTNQNTATAHGTYNGTVYNSTPKTATYATTALTLVKNAVDTSYTTAGTDTINYTYTVTNTGDAPLNGPVVVYDTNATVTCPDLEVADPDNFTDLDQYLEKDEYVICRAVYTVTAFDVSIGSITNSAYATVDSVRSNHSIEKVYSTKPDLVITKSNNVGGYATLGTPFTWTIRMANQGASDATFTSGSTILSDQLPTSASYGTPALGTSNDITNSGNVDCSIDGSKLLTCTASGADVVIGATDGYFNISFTVTPTAVGGLSNPEAIVDPVTDNVQESNEGNNKAADALNVTANADLVITKTDGVESVAVDSTVTYTIVVTNNGASGADGAVFSDPAVSNLSVSSVACGSASGSAVCPTSENTTVALMQGVGIVIPTLPSGGSLTFTVTGTAGSSGSITNTAYIIAPAGISDPTPENNQATDTDTISQLANLSITKTDGLTSVDVGSTLSYTIVISNAGPTAADGARFTDPTVSNLTFSGVTCGSASGGAACPTAENTTPALMTGSGVVIPTLPSGGSLTFTVTGTAGASGSIGNTASVATPSGIADPVLDNNSASDTTTINEATPELTIVKSVTESSYTAVADVLHYSYLVTNSGGTILVGPVTVSDDKSTDESCPDVNTIGNFDNNLDPGESIICSATYTIVEADIIAKSVTNTATATADSVTSASDSENVNLTRFSIVKSVTETRFTAAGNVLHYSYLVTNSGGTILAGPVTVSDDKSSDESCPNVNTVGNLDSNLDPGESITCSSTYTTTSADVTAKGVTNLAFASAGGYTSQTDSETVTLAALTLVKTATESSFTAAGNVLHYSYLVTNSGNTSLPGPVSINDDKSTDESCSNVSTVGNYDANLDPGESITCTATYTTLASDVTAKSVTNTATASADGVTSNTDSETVSLSSLILVKSVSESIYSTPGYVLHYSFLVTNNGNSALSGPVTISDDKTTDESCPNVNTVGNNDANLDPGESITCTSTYTILQSDIDSGSVTNSATATAGGVTSNTDSKTVSAYQNPLIHIVKTSTTTSITSAGQSVPYVFTVTNTGNLTLTGVTLSDPNCSNAISGPSGDDNSDSKLQPTETWGYSCSHVVTQAEMDVGGNLSNTATTDSTESAADTDTLLIPVTQSPSIHVVKSSTTTEVTAAGQTISYTFTVTNTGNIMLSGITVSDPNCTSAVGGPSGDANSDSRLQTTETWEYTCNHTVTQAEMDAGGNLSNTVTVDSTESSADTDTLIIPITLNPSIKVVKSSTTTSITAAGDVVPYKFTVTNTGNVTLTGITVSDPKCTTTISDPSGDANSDSKLQTTETWVYTCNRTVTQAEVDAGGNLSNTVTVDSTESSADTDTLDIPITQNSDLTFTKTAAETSFSSEGDVLHFTIKAHNSGNVQLSGVTVSDPQLTDLNCSPASPATLKPDETMTCTGTHTIVLADLTAGSYKNAASASASATPPGGPALTPTDDVTVNASSLIGLAKKLVSTAEVAGSPGTWDVTFEFVIHNYETDPMTNLQVVEDLETAFPSPTSITGIQQLSSTSLTVNSGFDGTSDQNLLTGVDTLAGGDEASILLVVRLAPAAGSFANIAEVQALDHDGKPVGDTSQNGSDPDPDHNGVPGDNSEVTPVTFSANIFDPPHGAKVYDDAGLPLLQWTMNWINDTNIVAVNAEVHDPISEGATFVATGPSSGYDLPATYPGGSTNVGVSCTESSAMTTTEFCYYEGPTDDYPRGQIIWKGTLGPDLGESDPAIAVNDIQIDFYIRVADGVTGVQNEASINADLNGDGDVEDSGETRVALSSAIWGTLPVHSAVSTEPLYDKLPDTGFMPDQITLLPNKPAGLMYSNIDGLTIEIPRLKLKTEILGVPQNLQTGEWDVSWLSDQVGWLNDTAFPTASGNSLLTAHVYLANGEPGPFVDLGTLKWGDRILIRSSGEVYVYEVREIKSVLPSNQTVFKHEEKAWITLITCQGYNERTGEYARRKVVRAVLISAYEEN